MSHNLATAKKVFDAKRISRGEVVEYPDLGICTPALRDPDHIQVELIAPYGQERTRAGSHLFSSPQPDAGKTTSPSFITLKPGKD